MSILLSAPPLAVAAGEQSGLLAVLAAVPDPRDPRGIRYPLASMLAVAVCAVLAGAVTFAAIADWVKDLDSPGWARLGFTGRIPVASTVWGYWSASMPRCSRRYWPAGCAHVSRRRATRWRPIVGGGG
jgi:hypothetical protein